MCFYRALHGKLCLFFVVKLKDLFAFASLHFCVSSLFLALVMLQTFVCALTLQHLFCVYLFNCKNTFRANAVKVLFVGPVIPGKTDKGEII